MRTSMSHKWTEEETQVLSDYITKDQMNHREISALMGIPLRSVQGKCSYLMLSIRKTREESYMKAMDNFYEKTNSWLAKHMGVSRGTISKWRGRYKKSMGVNPKHARDVKEKTAVV